MSDQDPFNPSVAVRRAIDRAIREARGTDPGTALKRAPALVLRYVSEVLAESPEACAGLALTLTMCDETREQVGAVNVAFVTRDRGPEHAQMVGELLATTSLSTISYATEVAIKAATSIDPEEGN